MAFVNIDGFPSGCDGKLLVFRGKEILVNGCGDAAGGPFPVKRGDVPDCFRDTLNRWGGEDSDFGKELIAVELAPGAEVPEGLGFIQLREYFASHSEEEVACVSKMKGYLNWRAATRFCGTCGTALEEHATENARVCPHCGRVHYPRIEPCVIVLVLRGDEVLLLRHKLRNQDIYACLAGFVEAGESLEYALRREIREETGLEVCNIRYQGSQSWPFPDQLMLAFYADYESGVLKVQEDEILEARWFRRDELPACPRPGSISWRLIHFDFDKV